MKKFVISNIFPLKFVTCLKNFCGTNYFYYHLGLQIFCRKIYNSSSNFPVIYPLIYLVKKNETQTINSPKAYTFPIESQNRLNHHVGSNNTLVNGIQQHRNTYPDSICLQFINFMINISQYSYPTGLLATVQRIFLNYY